MPRTLLTLPETAERTGLGEAWLRKLAARGILRASKVGRDWAVSETELARFLAERTRLAAEGRPYRPRSG
jgi:excisionase family DNA binding protein